MKYTLVVLSFLSLMISNNLMGSESFLKLITDTTKTAGNLIAKVVDPVAYTTDEANISLYTKLSHEIEQKPVKDLLVNAEFLELMTKTLKRASYAGPAVLVAMQKADITTVEKIYRINEDILPEPLQQLTRKYLATRTQVLAATIKESVEKPKKDINERFLELIAAENIAEALRIFNKEKDDLSGKSLKRAAIFFESWRDKLNSQFPDEKSDDDKSDDE